MVNEIKLDSEDQKRAHLNSLISIPSIRPRKYEQTSSYDRLDFIDHPEHGMGFVDRVLSSNEISVFFNTGPNVILHTGF